jgi:hypothetical protein
VSYRTRKRSSALSHHVHDGSGRQGRPAELFDEGVGGAGDIGARIGERPVQIEHDEAGHSVPDFSVTRTGAKDIISFAVIRR